LSWSLPSSRGWDNKNLVAYMESHDEERLMVRNLNEGRSQGAYNIRNFAISLERIKMGTAFFYTTPGAKMLWQFGELGYDFSINACPPDGQVIDDGCRTANKPIPWGEELGLNYHEQPARQRLYKATAAIINLVNAHPAFEEGQFDWTPAGALRRITIDHQDLDVVIVGNFGLTEGTIDPQFDQTGTWYDFFTASGFEVSNANAPVTLAPGEFHIYTDREVDFPEQGLVSVFEPVVTTSPEEFRAGQEVTIFFNAEAADPDGTAGLVGAEKVYLYAGAVTEGPQATDWAYITGSTDQDDGVGEMTRVEGEDNLWQITLTPRDYFQVPAEEDLYRIGMIFRNADGTSRGKGFGGGDIFVNVLPEGDLVSVSPGDFTINDEVTLTFDARLADPSGTSGLVGAEKVYMHSGIVVDGATSTSWTSVVGNWGEDDGVGEMTKVEGEDNLWQITFSPRDYYSIPQGTQVYRLGMVFRNADGTAEGKAEGGQDIFVEVDQVTGLGDRAAQLPLMVYPNPATGEAFVQLPTQTGNKFEVIIMNVTGQQVYRASLSRSNGWKDLRINTSGFNPGLYLLQLTDGKTLATGRLLVR